MIRRIIFENFRSHPRTVIEPAPGLTVLVGPNIRLGESPAARCGRPRPAAGCRLDCRRGDTMPAS